MKRSLLIIVITILSISAYAQTMPKSTVLVDVLKDGEKHITGKYPEGKDSIIILYQPEAYQKNTSFEIRLYEDGTRNILMADSVLVQVKDKKIIPLAQRNNHYFISSFDIRKRKERCTISVFKDGYKPFSKEVKIIAPTYISIKLFKE